MLLDRTGRRSIQILGFGMMALMFLIIGFVPVIAKHALPFLLLYGVSYFFTEFGPNTTTFIYPAELFPTEVRTTGHGIAACCSPLPRSPNPRENPGAARGGSVHTDARKSQDAARLG